MTNKSKGSDSMNRAYDEIDSLDSAAELLRSIDEKPVSMDERTSDQQHFWIESILRRAAECGDTDAERVTSFIQQYLLPHCVHPGDPEKPLFGHRLRELLRNWLESLPEAILWRVRHAVFEEILGQMGDRPTLGGLYSLSAIGYRSQATVQALKQVCENEDALGDTSLRLLVSLRPGVEDLRWVGQQICSRIDQRRNDDLLSAAAMLNDPGWIEKLGQIEIEEEPSWIGLSRLFWISEAVPGDLEIQERVWNTAVRVARTRLKGWIDLLFSGGVVSRCNTPRAVADLISELPNIHRLGAVHVWRWVERLQEAESPLQVQGWTQIDPGPAIDVLKSFAVHPVEDHGRQMTQELRLKNYAIEMLLSLGTNQVFDIVEATVPPDAGPYDKHGTMEQLSVLSLATLPKVAEHLLTTPLAFTKGNISSEELPFISAAGLAASSLHASSLRLLLYAHGTIEGHPFLMPVEAAAELADWLISQSDTTAPRLLSDAVRQSDLPMAQSIGVRALRLLAERGRLPNGFIEFLFEVAGDERRPSYVRTDAVSGLMTAGLGKNSQALADLLAKLAESTHPDLRALAITSIVWLNRSEEFREQVESFVWPDGRSSNWATKASTSVAQVVGQLSACYPERFSSAAAELLEHGSIWTADSVLWGYGLSRRGSAVLPDKMVSAAIRRISRDETSSIANPPLFRRLAPLAAERFVAADWPGVWNDWMADSRQALAEALPDAVAHLSPSNLLRDRAANLLEELLQDGTFAVRRSAARSLSRLDMDRFAAWSHRAAGSGSIDLRCRAAEASSWLPIDSERTIDNELLRTLAADTERIVRGAAERSRKDARCRAWSAQLMQIVQTPQEDANTWVLASYAAGAALSRVGDDLDIETLERLSEKPEIPPNVRYWLKRVGKNLERQWKKTTKEWPQPWLPWRGAIEEVNGELLIAGRTYPAKLSLWNRVQKSPDDIISWGGAAQLSDRSVWRVAESFLEGEIEVRLTNRANAHALMTELRGGQLLFSGTGPYPDSTR